MSSSFIHDRIVDCAAMQALSEGNWEEMNGGELALFYNFKRALVRAAHRRFPKSITPLYTMIAFTDTGYSRAVFIDKIHSLISALVLVVLSIIIVTHIWTFIF
jgi:hypothetical protein